MIHGTIFMQMFDIHLPVQEFRERGMTPSVLGRWLASNDVAENCVRSGHSIWQASFGSVDGGVCVPNSCSSEILAEQSVNSVVALSIDRYRSFCRPT